MNLSTDKAVDIIIEITPYVADIVNDADLAKLIGRHKKADGKKQTEQERNIKYFAELIPAFLKRHREPIYIILAALNETTVAEIRGQSITKTIKQIREIMNDAELVDFFQSFSEAAPKTAAGSTARQ